MTTRPFRSILTLATLAFLPVTAHAQGNDRFRPGEVTERVECLEAPTEHYAAYLPSAYVTDRKWPVLLAMDPRGRALVPLELFRDAAERFGYIIVSAYGTRSDAPGDPSGDALRAIMPEIGRRFALDNHRLYLAGFSGTARTAWAFSESLEQHLAGIVGFGAAAPSGYSGRYVAPFFGGAGTTDFNYDEVWALGETLEKAGVAHRIRPYEGGHSWPPAPVAAEAIAWMELQAMRTELRPADADLIGALFTEALARAEATSDLYLQAARFRHLVEDFEGLVDVSAAAERAASLQSSEAVRKAASRRQKILERQLAFVQDHQRFLSRFLEWEQPPLLRWSLDELPIRALQRRARATKDTLDAEAAQRSLNLVFVYAAYYQPRDYLEAGDPTRALAALGLAEALQPDTPRVCYGYARARAALGRTKEALSALACAAEGGLVDRRTLEEDPYLAPLRGEARYQEIAASLPGPGTD